MNHPLTCALALAIATSLAGGAYAATAASSQETSMPAPTYNGPFAQPSTLDLHYPQRPVRGPAAGRGSPSPFSS